MADLAARLAALKDRSTLRITTRGRRTGKPHTVPIWFVADGTSLYLATLNAKRDWVRNLRKTPDVALEVGELRVRGRARVVTDPVLEGRIGDLLARKYWMAWIGAWFRMGAVATFRVDEQVGTCAAPMASASGTLPCASRTSRPRARPTGR